MNVHYLSLSDEAKSQGIYKFARRLPDESNGIIRALYQRHTKGLLEPPREIKPDKLDPDAHKKIVDQIEGWKSASSATPQASEGGCDELESVVIERSITRKRGSWFQVGPDIKDSE